MMLQLDETTEKFLDMYAEHMRQRPPEPDPDVHVVTEELRLIARRRDEWEQTERALWLMISTRIGQQAIDEYPDAI